nr:DegT/DnrJ/EryC1/StrS family aminotransferase [Candidatus Accumulibacter aalborgensis]
MRGRYALGAAYRLAGLDSEGVLLAPAYHCVTMLDPALALNAEVHLYPLQADLSPDLVALDLLLARIQKPVKALLATHYFGIVRDFCGLRQWCVDRHIVLIEDCSHVLFTENFRAPGSGIHGQFVVSSPYKFFACDDGGLLYAPDACLLENVATRSATFFEELRGIKHVLERGRSTGRLAGDLASIDLRLADISAGAVALGNHEVIERSAPSSLFSELAAARASLRCSQFVAEHSSLDDNIRCRRENYQRWVQAVATVPNCHALFPILPTDCAPYMFPLYIDHPDPHFYWLKHLGVPIWRWDEMADSACRISQDYRQHLLHLPCHQSLTGIEMDWMTAAVDKTLHRSVAGAR